MYIYAIKIKFLPAFVDILDLSTVAATHTLPSEFAHYQPKLAVLHTEIQWRLVANLCPDRVHCKTSAEIDINSVCLSVHVLVEIG